MVYKHSKLPIVDNTGIKLVKVIHVYDYPLAMPGDIVLSTVRVKRRAKAYVKKQVNNTFVVTCRRRIYRARGGYFLRLVRNQGIVLGADDEKILGTRHKAFLTLESRKKAFVQLLRTCRVVV